MAHTHSGRTGANLTKNQRQIWEPTVFKNWFNRKVIALQEQNEELAQEVARLRLEVHNEQGRSAGLYSQTVQLRKLASQLRERIQSHGKTTEEARFIASCLDIHKNGRTLSARRFNASMTTIASEREAMTDWSQEAKQLEVTRPPHREHVKRRPVAGEYSQQARPVGGRPDDVDATIVSAVALSVGYSTAADCGSGWGGGDCGGMGGCD